jgi:hypothetical protein
LQGFKVVESMIPSQAGGEEIIRNSEFLQSTKVLVSKVVMIFIEDFVMVVCMGGALAETERKHRELTGIQVNIQFAPVGGQSVFPQEQGMRQWRIHGGPTVQVGGIVEAHPIQKAASAQFHTAGQIRQLQEVLLPFPFQLVIRVGKRRPRGKSLHMVPPAQ